MATFNGAMPIGNTKPIIDVEVDACNRAASMCFRGDWQFCPFQHDFPTLTSWNINYNELLSVYLAACRWGHLWGDSHVVIHTDSMVAQAILNKGTTRHPVIIQVLRKLFWLAASFNFDVSGSYVPGKTNTRADAISRLQQPGQFLRLDSLSQYS